MINRENDRTIRLLRDAHDGVKHAELDMYDLFGIDNEQYQTLLSLRAQIGKMMEARHDEIDRINAGEQSAL